MKVDSSGNAVTFDADGSVKLSTALEPTPFRASAKPVVLRRQQVAHHPHVTHGDDT